MTARPFTPGMTRRASRARARHARRHVSLVARAQALESAAALIARASGGRRGRRTDQPCARLRTVATSCRWWTRRVDPDEVRSTMISAMSRCGAISVAPETGTRVAGLVTAGEELMREVRKYGRHSRRSDQIVNGCDAAVIARSHDEPAASELEIEEHPQFALRLAHEIPTVTPTSAAPSATNSGISLARTRMASNSPPSDTTSARSPRARTSRPASRRARAHLRKAGPCSATRLSALPTSATSISLLDLSQDDTKKARPSMDGPKTPGKLTG